MAKEIKAEETNPIPQWLFNFYNPLVGKRMIELGNKKTKMSSGQWITYKEYFESIGIDHVSIDWNGHNPKCLNLDLRKPIDLESADMVTNIGTTEHVSNQVGVWQNIHNFCKVGGVLISCTPLKDDWWWHGDHYPTEEFFNEFTKNGYEIDLMEILNEHPRRVLTVRMNKISHEPFVMPNENTIFNNKKRPRNSK